MNKDTEMKKLTNEHIAYFVIITVFLILFPVANLTGLMSDNTLSLWGRYFCFAIAAIGVDLIWGYTGILSMCQAFFFCLGGYGVAMHMLLADSAKGAEGAVPDFMVWNQVEELPWFWEPFYSPVLSFLLIIIVPGLFAGVFGYFIFRSRLKGVYLAIITQALALAMWLLFLRNETMLGGTNGLTDYKTLLGFDLSNAKLGLYITSFLALAGIYFMIRQLTKSKFGKVLVAIRDSEPRISYVSYKVRDYKLAVFIIAAVVAAIGGMLYVPQTGIITPGRMDVRASIEMIMWVALGGRGRLKGAVIGAVLVNVLYSLFTSMFPGSWLYILGILFILTVLFFDKGFMGLLDWIEKQVMRLGKKKTTIQAD